MPHRRLERFARRAHSKAREAGPLDECHEKDQLVTSSAEAVYSEPAMSARQRGCAALANLVTPMAAVQYTPMPAPRYGTAALATQRPLEAQTGMAATATGAAGLAWRPWPSPAAHQLGSL